jgi:predicted ABC-type transport system involved in lysophospholipase L1 biosynthesis ATPase subunit
VIVKVAGLTKRHDDGRGRRLTVLQGASFTIAEGDRVALMGKSGAGKSSLLHVLGGLDTDFEGEVEVLGQRLGGLSDVARSRLRNARLGFVFQSYHLIPNLVAWRNVALAASFSPEAVPNAEARAREALARVGLEALAGSRPSELSGGERQRVAIARALFFQPPLLLCDEPTGNLDQQTAASIIDLLLELNRQQGVTLVIATHEEQVARAAARTLRIENGALKADP